MCSKRERLKEIGKRRLDKRGDVVTQRNLAECKVLGMRTWIRGVTKSW